MGIKNDKKMEQGMTPRSRTRDKNDEKTRQELTSRDRTRGKRKGRNDLVSLSESKSYNTFHVEFDLPIEDECVSSSVGSFKLLSNEVSDITVSYYDCDPDRYLELTGELLQGEPVELVDVEINKMTVTLVKASPEGRWEGSYSGIWDTWGNNGDLLQISGDFDEDEFGLVRVDFDKEDCRVRVNGYFEFLLGGLDTYSGEGEARVRWNGFDWKRLTVEYDDVEKALLVTAESKETFTYDGIGFDGSSGLAFTFAKTQEEDDRRALAVGRRAQDGRAGGGRRGSRGRDRKSVV